MPSDAEVASTAAEAAENEIFTHYAASDVRDFDVTVHFDGVELDVDVYLNTGGQGDPEAVVEAAIQAAEEAVDELLESS